MKWKAIAALELLVIFGLGVWGSRMASGGREVVLTVGKAERSGRGNLIVRPMRPVGLGVALLVGRPVKKREVLRCKPRVRMESFREGSVTFKYPTVVLECGDTKLVIKEVIW